MDELNGSDVENATLSTVLVAFSCVAKECHDGYCPYSDGDTHLVLHGVVNIAIMNMPAFLALIKS
jgi:hypothetical protein